MGFFRSIVSRTLAGVARSASWASNTIGLGGYTATDPRRKILSPRRPTKATANELATSSLPQLRNYGRHLERNNPTMRAGVDGLVALVVGSGIDLEPDTGDEKVDEAIRKEWKDWCDSCAVDGRDVFQLQSQGFREVVAAGEGLWRLVMLPERAASGEIPLAVLPLESEWLDDDCAGVAYNDNGSTVRVGPITLDRYGRAVSYTLKNPDLNAIGGAEEVPASAVMHFFEKRRSMQARGEPWAAPIIETLQQERDLVDAELQAAVTSSSIGLAVTSTSHDPLDSEEDGDTDDPAHSLRIGGVARLYPGDSVESFANTRPSQQIMPFRAGLRGDTAAALRLPQRFLDRDVSRANYSSMRADMLDTDRLLSPVREWYGHATIGRLYKEVLPFLALRAGVAVPRAKYRLIPDGQPYVDPTKDVKAALEAINGNLSTYEAEVGKRGGDYRKLWEQRAKEKTEEDALGLKPEPEPSAFGGDSAPKAEQEGEEAEKEGEDEKEEVEDLKRSVADLQSRAPFVIHNHLPQSVTSVAAPNVTVEAARVDVPATIVNLPETVVNVAPAVVNIAATEVRNEIAAPVIPAPVVHVAAPVVNVTAPSVTVENEVIVPQRTVRAVPDGRGGVLMTPEE
jgi:lambda family phage portal protein